MKTGYEWIIMQDLHIWMFDIAHKWLRKVRKTEWTDSQIDEEEAL